MATETHLVYFLDVRVPGADPNRIRIDDTMTLGSDKSADILLKDYDLPPLAAKFRYTNEVLTVTNLGGDHNAKIGKQELGHGKMYILDKGDKVEFGDIKIIIRRDKVKEEVPEEEEDEVEEEEIVAPKVEPTKEIEIEAAEEAEEEEEYEYVEEEVEVEEEVDEDDDTDPAVVSKLDKSGKKGFLGLFGGGKKKEEEKKAPPKAAPKAAPKIAAKKSGKVFPHPPGFFVRFVALLTSLFMVFAFVFYVLPDLGLEKHFDKAFEEIGKKLPEIKEKMTEAQQIPAEVKDKFPNTTEELKEMAAPVLHVIIAILVFMAFDLAGHILFGTSLPLFLCGVTEHGGLIGSRLKGIFRSIIGWITLPLIIFDLPAMIGKRTLKEVLTFTHLHYRNGFFKFFGTFILCPIIMLASVATPLLMQYEEVLKPMEIAEVKPQRARKNKEPLPNTKPIKTLSKTFALRINTEWNDNILIVPDIQKIKDTKIPSIHFLDVSKQSEAVLSHQGEIDLNPAFKSILTHDPLFKILSPELYGFMAEEKSSPLVRTQIDQIIKQSLGMTAMKLHEFILKRGVFFAPYLQIRKAILKDIDLPENRNIEILSSTTQKYLKIQGQKRGDIWILPMEGMKLPVYKLSYKGKGGTTSTKVIQNFFQQSKPLDEADKAELDFKTVKEWSGFTVLDFLNVIDTYQPVAKELKGPVNYYIALGKTALQQENPYLKDNLIRILKKIDNTFKKMDTLDPMAKELNVNMNRIQKALEDGDKKFFKAN